MSRKLTLAVAVTLGIAGCGHSGGLADPGANAPLGGSLGAGPSAGAGADSADTLGFPTLATKNTTRLPASDATATAAIVARVVFPDPTRRPAAVALVDRNDWQGAIAAAALMARPIRAPLLLTDGTSMPAASQLALAALAPVGAASVGKAQVIRIGAVASPSGLRAANAPGANPYARARAVAGLIAGARGRLPTRVIVTTGEDPDMAAPAAAYAAKSGDPILFVKRDSVPPETQAELVALNRPRIYVLGPSSVISPHVTSLLRRLGTVRRTGGPDPVANAIQFARYRDGAFGWGIVDPGHGLVFARQGVPLEAPVAAALSGSGTFGPLLLVDSRGALPQTLQQYLLDIQPGFVGDPVRGVYNHGWLIGDSATISAAVQSRIDALLEIVPVQAPNP